MTNTTTPFTPDWASPPGDSIADALEEQGTSITFVMERMDLNINGLISLINGDLAITSDMAVELSSVLGESPIFWERREKQYRDALARVKPNNNAVEYLGVVVTFSAPPPPGPPVWTIFTTATVPSPPSRQVLRRVCKVLYDLERRGELAFRGARH